MTQWFIIVTVNVATLFHLGASHQINWFCSAMASADSGLNTASKYPCTYKLWFRSSTTIKCLWKWWWGAISRGQCNSSLKELTKQNLMFFTFNPYQNWVSNLCIIRTKSLNFLITISYLGINLVLLCRDQKIFYKHISIFIAGSPNFLLKKLCTLCCKTPELGEIKHGLTV